MLSFYALFHTIFTDNNEKKTQLLSLFPITVLCMPLRQFVLYSQLISGPLYKHNYNTVLLSPAVYKANCITNLNNIPNNQNNLASQVKQILIVK